MANFDLVAERVKDAKGIAWDGCHKIYVLMDDDQMELMKAYDYDPLIYAEWTTPEKMLELLKKWYDESCGLKFISAVTTNNEDPNAGFEDLIPQFEEDSQCYCEQCCPEGHCDCEQCDEPCDCEA